MGDPAQQAHLHSEVLLVDGGNMGGLSRAKLSTVSDVDTQLPAINGIQTMQRCHWYEMEGTA